MKVITVCLHLEFCTFFGFRVFEFFGSLEVPEQLVLRKSRTETKPSLSSLNVAPKSPTLLNKPSLVGSRADG